MKLVNQYIIPYKGLKEGEHDFNFEIGNTFFEEYSSLEIKSGFIEANVLLHRKSNFLELSVVLKGDIEIQCDRCLEDFTFPINYIGDLYVKFKDLPEEPDDKVIFLNPNEENLDLTQYFLDCVALSLPIQRFHPEDENGFPGCDEDMLEKLQEHSYNQSSDDEEIDPRWSKLKDLLNKENKH